MVSEEIEQASTDTPSSSPFEVIAAGTTAGLRIWTISSDKTNQARKPVLAGHFLKKQSVNAITITKRGDRIITGYTATDGRERLAVWTLTVDPDNKLKVLNKGPHEILEEPWGKTTSLATANTTGEDVVLVSGQNNNGHVKMFRLEGTNLTTFKSLSTQIRHRETIWSINVWTNDGRTESENSLARIATASEDGSVSVWQTSDWKKFEQVAKFTGHQGPVYTAVFANRNQIASGGNDRKIILWSPLSTGAKFQDALKTGVKAAINPDNETKQIDVYKSRVVGYHDASIHCLATIRENTKNQTKIFSGSNDNTIRIWNAPDKRPTQLIKALRGHGQWVTACLLISDNRLLVSGALDGIKKWEWRKYQNPIVFADGLSTDLGSQSIELSAIGVEHAACSPDGQWIAAARSDGRINFWDTNMHRKGGSHEFLPNSLMFYQKGSRVMTSAGDNSTRLWDVENQTQINALLGTGPKGIAVISEDGKICITGSDEPEKPARAWGTNKVDNSWKTLDAFDEMLASAGEVFAHAGELQQRNSITSIALSSDATFGLLCDKQGNCLLFAIDKNMRQFKLMEVIATGQQDITNSVFHPSEPAFFTGNFSGRITKWKFDYGPTPNIREVEFRRVNGPIKALTVSADGQKVLAGFTPPNIVTQPGKQDSPSRETAYLLDASNFEILQKLQTSKRLPQLKTLIFSRNPGSALVLAVPTDASTESLIGEWTFETGDFRLLQGAEFGETVNIAVPQASAPDQVSRLLTFSSKGIELWNTNEILQTETEKRKIGPVAVFKKSDKAIFAAFDSSSRQACTIDSEGRMILWNHGNTGWQQARVIKTPDSKIIAANFSLDNPQQLFTLEQNLGDDKSGFIREWTLEEGKWRRKATIARLTRRPKCFKLVADEESRELFIVGHDAGFEIWQYSDDESVFGTRLLAREVVDGVDCLAFSANQNRLVTASGTKALIWRISNKTATKSEELYAETAKIRSVDISEDGHRVLTGGEDFMTKLWEVQSDSTSSNEPTSIPVMNLTPHTRSVTTVIFSKAGNDVLTAGEDGRIILEKIIKMPVAINADKFVKITENTFTHLASNASIRNPTNYSFDNATLFIKSNLPANRTTVQINPSSESANDWLIESIRPPANWSVWDLASADDINIMVRSTAKQQRIKPTLVSVQKLIREIEVKTSSIANGSPYEVNNENEITIQLHNLYADDTKANAESRLPTSSLPLKIQVNLTSPSDEN